MPYYELDRSEWPLVTVTFVGPPTDDAFDEYLADLDALYERDAPFAIIFDAREAGYLPAEYRQRQADWMAANEEKMRRQLAGTAYVLSSAVLRGVLRAIFALQSQPAPYTVVGSLDAARSWAYDQLEDA